MGRDRANISHHPFEDCHNHHLIQIQLRSIGQIKHLRDTHTLAIGSCILQAHSNLLAKSSSITHIVQTICPNKHGNVSLFNLRTLSSLIVLQVANAYHLTNSVGWYRWNTYEGSKIYMPRAYSVFQQPATKKHVVPVPPLLHNGQYRLSITPEVQALYTDYELITVNCGPINRNFIW